MQQQEDTMLKRGMRGLARATLITLTLGNVCLAWAARAESPRPPNAAEGTKGNVTMTWVSSETTTVAGEPLSYPSTPNPVISSNVLTIAPGTVTQWMTHPAPAYVYVMEGTLTVEFAADGSRHEFKAGQAFLQARTHWHRGRNDGSVPVRFLGVFVGAKDVPDILHPPSGNLDQ
jgi:quercetin dioxygenase-like cupin family protein